MPPPARRPVSQLAEALHPTGVLFVAAWWDTFGDIHLVSQGLAQLFRAQLVAGGASDEFRHVHPDDLKAAAAFLEIADHLVAVAFAA